MKYCWKCKQDKDPSDFYKCKRNYDGRQTHCKECDKTYKQEHKDRYYLLYKNWAKNNPDKVKQRSDKYYNKNKKLVMQKAMEYGRANPGKRRAQTRKRQMALLQRIPKWADLKAILKFYENCPKGYEVDHIIPLRGKTVSGLHVLNNLQYLTPTENRSKGNKYVQE